MIRIEGLGKEYRLGEVTTGTLSHDLNRWWHRFRGRPDPYQQIGTSALEAGDAVWALRDVDLTVRRGEVWGIIGKNGAGKSTLLKILSRITTPTRGCIKVKGRIGSLLEVGTGFHPDLTGRENVFQNGAILGMTRREIQSKFDAIVDFSGIERYIDTPVKRYSTGMTLRLAFAVAAFLEPEILIIDEVLAVGDADFQRKCLGRMKDLSTGKGRTILFVSHNLAALKALCEHGLLLKDGRVRLEGGIEEAIAAYIGDSRRPFAERVDLEAVPRERGARQIIFKEVEFDSAVYYPTSPFHVRLRLKQVDPDFRPANLNFGLHVVDQFENQIYHLSNLFVGRDNVPFSEQAVYSFTLPMLHLRPGVYSIWLWLQANGDEQDWVTSGVPLEVQPGNVYGFPRSSIVSGVVQPDFRFTCDLPVSAGQVE